MSEQKNNLQQPEQDLSQQRQVRREKLAALQAEGQDPFLVTRFDWDHTAQQIKDNFDALEGQAVKVAGRLMSKRGMGKVSFCDLQDRSGRIQLYARQDEMDEAVYKKMCIRDRPTDVIQSLFPDRQNDFVLSVGEGDVVLIRQMPEGAGIKELNKIAASVEETLRAGGEPAVVVGIGTVTTHLRDLAKSYKEAQIAIEVGKVFDTEKYVINYENLGIGRLIYQLPTTLCEMFLQEVFKKNPIDALDKETLFTIHKFFENNLNVSETARKLFVHRNTLVYRLEKIKKLTGLDLREFDDAITFKVALMVKKYLTSRGIDS